MIKFRYAVISFLLIFLVSCTSSSVKESNSTNAGQESVSENTEDSEKNMNSESTSSQISRIEDAVYLEGFYATNTALPIKQYHITNLFDNNDKTIWKTPLGAGTNEGIMLYFSEPVEIAAIEITNIVEDEMVGVLDYQIFENGVLRPAVARNNVKYQLSSKISSLFIRIGKLVNSKNVDVSENLESYEETITVNPKDKSVGLKDIRFFDKNGKIIQVVAPKMIPCTITASSTLEPLIGYSQNNLVDSKKAFGWAEGAKGNGEGEWVKFSFKENTTISALKLWNGYQRSSTHFNDNARLKSFTFGSSEGEMNEYSFEDMQDGQLISLNKPVSGKEFMLKIISVYPGKKYKDMVLSEILFYNNNVPVLPLNNYEEEKCKNSRNIESRQLQNVLDRLIDYSGVVVADFSDKENINKSFILRSNNSFVYYKDNVSSSWGENSSKTQIADGSWEFVSKSANSVTIRLFGKFHISSQVRNVYKGDSDLESVNIFQDNITITDSTLEGKSFIPKFDLKW